MEADPDSEKLYVSAIQTDNVQETSLHHAVSLLRGNNTTKFRKLLAEHGYKKINSEVTGARRKYRVKE
jgi:hypothetical protein